MKLHCQVNGEEIAADVEERVLLSDFLRHQLRLTGTNVGCEMGVCGACTVIVAGEAVRSCLMFAVQAEGLDIRTVEDLADGDTLSPLQLAFQRHHALQCGYCTPGILMTLQALAERGALPATEAEARDALSGSICRCTGYQNIIDAALAMTRQRDGSKKPHFQITKEAAQFSRREDATLLRGRARFVDNIHLDRMVHGAFVRSNHAHAEIRAIDPSRALAAGALAVISADDLPFNDEAWVVRYWNPCIRNGLPKFLATDRVRFVGEPIAFVVAKDRYHAEDFAHLVEINYQPLPAIADIVAAGTDTAEPLHPQWTGNVAAEFEHHHGNAERALAASAHRVRRRFNFARQAPIPLETRGVVADFDAERNCLTAWLSTQPHYNVRQNLAKFLGLSEQNVRVIAEDVGGGFGSKSRPYPEEMIAAHASRILRRPVKWIEDRFENLQATTHSRAMEVDLEIACDAEGHLTALQAEISVDIGAYVFTSGIATAQVAAAHIANAYRFPHIAVIVRCIGTNKTPIGTYRGAGQPEVAFPMECLLDVLAKEIGLQAAELRARNIVRPADMPYRVGTTLLGADMIYENSDFPRAFETALEASGFTEKVEITPEGQRIAYGIGCGVETGGLVNFESAHIRVDPDGTVAVASGMSSQGQGQRTTYAQVCADTLGVPSASVSVQLGDTGLIHFGRGAFAARGAVMGASAVFGAAQRLRDKALGHAALLLQCAVADLTIVEGKIVYIDGRQSDLSIGQIARELLPGGALFAGEPALDASYVYEAKHPLTSGFSAHIAKVRLDPSTGFFSVDAYYVTHDAGRALNQTIVDGQVVGAVADGIGGAMLSEFIYDAEAQPLTSTLADYLVASACEIPRITVVHLNSPSSTNPLGVRGVGEGGIIPVAAALTNALARAIDPDRVGHEHVLFSLPLKPERVLAACEVAAKNALAAAQIARAK
jgi:aerobic carbon-monoxide dehydrogenase large subunit